MQERLGNQSPFLLTRSLSDAAASGSLAPNLDHSHIALASSSLCKKPSGFALDIPFALRNMARLCVCLSSAHYSADNKA